MDNQNYSNWNVPAGPLLPQNDPSPLNVAYTDGIPASFYGGHDPFADAVSPLDNPSVAEGMHQAIASAIKPTTIAEPDTDILYLPVPALINGVYVNTAQVRELNGGDEEKLVRANLSDEPERVLDTLLQCGVVLIGDITPTAADLLDLAVPNRDALLLAIRRVTYGNEVKFERLGCLHCGSLMYVTYDLNDIPRAENALVGGDFTTRVPLRKGGQAVLRLPSGADQIAILSEIRAKEINRAEQDSLLIALCLETVIQADGTVLPSGGITQAKAFSMSDRSAILKAMDNNRPGPHLEEAKVTCPDCERETGVPLSVDILFRG